LEPAPVAADKEHRRFSIGQERAIGGTLAFLLPNQFSLTYLMESDVTTHSKWIDIAADDGAFQSYLALPHTGNGPGIVLIQEIFGVNQHIREVADQYAADGYVVLAPDIFWRSEPRVELGYEGADREKGIAIMQHTDFTKTLKDLGATAQALRGLPQVDGKIAAIGYCLGGRLAYNSAASGFVDAAVAYYGGGIQNQLERAAEIKTPILFHHAEEDSSIPLSAVAEIKKRFAGRDDAEFHLYMGAHHGFNCPYRAAYQQHASALAHGRTLVFLADHL
jgi:carboxymethylenebutenolidase